MVESLRELNKICQKPRYKEVGNWYVRHIVRDAALPVTQLLLRTPITANQVTLISIGIGVISALFFACPSSLSFVIGALLLQLWYLLDHVDGQIARYYKTASLTGRFYDFVMHHLIHGLLPFGLGAFVASSTGSVLFYYWGFASAISVMMFNLVHDTKYKTFFEAMDKADSIKLKEKGAQKADALSSDSSKTSTLKKVYSFLHKSVEIHVMMNILTVIAFLMVFLPLNWVRTPVFLYYGFVLPFLAISKNYYLIKTHKIDEEFKERFEIE